MEEIMPMLPKIIEIGVLGATTVILIFKGIDRMNELTANLSKLTDKIERMQDATNARFAALELDIRDLRNSVDALVRRLELNSAISLRKDEQQ